VKAGTEVGGQTVAPGPVNSRSGVAVYSEHGRSECNHNISGHASRDRWVFIDVQADARTCS
jgi:hypothetical protein